MTDTAFMLVYGAALAFLLSLIISGLFMFTTRRRPARRLDHFGSRVDG